MPIPASRKKAMKAISGHPLFSEEADDAFVASALDELSRNSSKWRALPLREKLTLLQQTRRNVSAHLTGWAKEISHLIGMPPEDASMQLLVLTTQLVSHLDKLMESLEHKDKHGVFPSVQASSSSSQQVVRVFPTPADASSLMTKTGLTVDVFLKPEEEGVTQGFAPLEEEGVSVVLGAGNQDFLEVCDVLHCLFHDGNTVLLKHSPVRLPTASYVFALLKPFADAGYLAGMCSSVPVASAAIYNPQVTAVHMTGGGRTHDAIVWGPSLEEQTKRKARDDPVLKKPMTSELGCVTPYIICPGHWTEEEVHKQAVALVEAAYANSGCNCLSPKVVFVADEWAHKEAFVAEVKGLLMKKPTPSAWYPGIKERYEAFHAAYPDAEAVEGTRSDRCDTLPYLLNSISLDLLDPRHGTKAKEEYAFNVEPFAPVLTFCSLRGSEHSRQMSDEEEDAMWSDEEAPPKYSVSSFLRQVVPLVNDHLFGTLSAILVVDARVEMEEKEAVDGAIEALRYGGVCVNTFGGLLYGVSAGTWGAFGGGEDLKDIGSGKGHVHNALFLRGTEKSVVRIPFDNALTSETKLPFFVSKMICGYVEGGWTGMVKGMLW